MATRIVSSQYKDVFRSIVWLSRNGLIANVRLICKDDNHIQTQEDEFVLSETDEGDRSGSRFFMGDSGASWFANLRGENSNGDAGAWKNLIDLVAEDYHRNYSFLTYERRLEDGQFEQDRTLAERFFEGVIRRICPDKNFLLSPAVKSDVEICGLSLRLTVGFGVGESQPVLGNIFFRREGNDYVPIERADAANIREAIARTPGASFEGSKKLEETHALLRDRAFAAMTECVEASEEGRASFTDYFVFSKEDESMLRRKRAEFSPNGALALECSQIKALGISSVKWEASRFDVLLGVKPVMRLEVGLSGAVDAYCVNCGEHACLVRSGRILGKEGKFWELDGAEKDFSLTKDKIEDIRKNSLFSDHLIKVDCSDITSDGCTRTACRSQIAESDGRMICRGCNKPEVFYTDLFDPGYKGQRTEKLTFAFDRMRMVSDGTYLCECCGKTYVRQPGQLSDLCPNCAEPDGSEEGVGRYRYYRQILSPAVRLRHMFSKKSCKEFKSLLIFSLGNDVYVFDKVSATNGGLIKGPRKFRRSRS